MSEMEEFPTKRIDVGGIALNAVDVGEGRPNAYARGGPMQKLKGWYLFFMQLRGFFELSLRAFNWWGLRIATNFPAETPDWIRLLKPPGRLTAAVNYYRANFVEMVFTADYPNVKIPVVGMFSDGDRFLTEQQIKQSECYRDSGFNIFGLTEQTIGCR